MGLSEAPGQRDTQALLSTTEAMELRQRDYHVERPLLNQEQLEELGSRSPAPYSVRDWLLGDLLSGLSVAIMQLPQVYIATFAPLGLAYALLAGLPPVFGLYSSFYPVFVYFLFGTSRHISVGTFAVMSVMVGSVMESLAPDDAFLLGLNSTLDVAARDATRVQLASTLSVLVGLFQVGLGMVHFGFVVTYLSEPLVRAYTTAASVHVFVSQLKYVFGLHLSRRSGPLSLIYTVLEVCWKLPETVVGTMVTAIVAGVVLVLVKLLNEKLRRHLPMPLPGELLTLIGATGISYGVGLKQAFGVDIVGKIPSGLVPPMVPRPQLFVKLLGNAFAIAVVGFAIAISLGKIFALRHGYRVYSNQELVALGLSNLIGGIFRCFPVSCSMSRSLVQESTGGNTQVAGAISSLFILIIIFKLGELFQDLPKAVLAAVVIVNLKGMVMQFTDVFSLWKANRVDLLIWVVTFVATILLNLDLGLAVAVVFSLMLVVVRTQMEVPGVKVFRSSVTVYFANAELYSDSLKQRCGVDVDYLLSQKKKLLRKQDLKLKRLQKENKPPKQAGPSDPSQAASQPPGCSPSFFSPSPRSLAATSKDTSISINVNTSVMDIESNNDVEGSKAKEASAGTELEDTGAWAPEDAKASDMSSLKALGLPQPDFHTLILDLSSFSFVDTVCLKSLKNIFRDFREIEVEVYMAACQAPVITQLENGHFFDASITKQHLFASVHDAVLFALQHRRSGPIDPVLVTKL
ncbi:hypothetical protein Celaphus_00010571 [Cervus elaphus hippelaphus]|uniref:STAS domain-containing protein n=1 Tax=Cervus elaphus hippelaphus TaxID=46360 RepID=A0A212C945_CEREH|nr:hypothetical protein Celaphus_00010571 [Cervus elaphus hippelaphus]